MLVLVVVWHWFVNESWNAWTLDNASLHGSWYRDHIIWIENIHNHDNACLIETVETLSVCILCLQLSKLQCDCQFFFSGFGYLSSFSFQTFVYTRVRLLLSSLLLLLVLVLLCLATKLYL